MGVVQRVQVHIRVEAHCLVDLDIVGASLRSAVLPLQYMLLRGRVVSE